VGVWGSGKREGKRKKSRGQTKNGGVKDTTECNPKNNGGVDSSRGGIGKKSKEVKKKGGACGQKKGRGALGFHKQGCGNDRGEHGGSRGGKRTVGQGRLILKTIVAPKNR